MVIHMIINFAFVFFSHFVLTLEINNGTWLTKGPENENVFMEISTTLPENVFLIREMSFSKHLRRFMRMSSVFVFRIWQTTRIGMVDR